MAGVEISAVEAWLAQRLAADAQLRSLGLTGSFSEHAPDNQPSPYVVWQQQGATDVTTQSGVRIDVELVYLIRVIALTHSYTTIQPIADRLDALLHLSGGVALGKTIMACVREEPYSQVEDYGDVTWRHLGGRYRIWVQ